MELKDLQQPNHKILYRLLDQGWIDREAISEKMFLNDHQISCMISALRNKGVNIETKSHPTKYRCKMFRLGELGDMQTRNEGVNRLLVSEMNQIRILAEARLNDKELASGLIEIKYRAERALQACGLLTDTTVID